MFYSTGYVTTVSDSNGAIDANVTTTEGENYLQIGLPESYDGSDITVLITQSSIAEEVVKTKTIGDYTLTTTSTQARNDSSTCGLDVTFDSDVSSNIVARLMDRTGSQVLQFGGNSVLQMASLNCVALIDAQLDLVQLSSSIFERTKVLGSMAIESMNGNEMSVNIAPTQAAAIQTFIQ